MNLTVIRLNCHFLQLKIFALAINVNDGKCKKHVHDVYLVKDNSVCILVCSFVIDSVQLTEKCNNFLAVARCDKYLARR